jgi:hypothetical protein
METIKAPRARRDLLDLLVRLEKLEQQDLSGRQAQLENLVHQDRQAQRDLLVRLESVVVNAQQHWYHKTTLLKWMIIILGLIVADRLLSLFPLIAPIVTKLL